MTRLLLALLAPFLLAAAPASQVSDLSAGPQPAPQRTKGAPSLGDFRPADVGAGAFDTVAERFGGQFFSLDEPWFSLTPTHLSGTYRLRFNDTGTGWQENVILGVPEQPLAPAPLLVMFHAFGVSEMDCLRNTSLMKHAMNRGWYVIAPRGAHDVTFSIPYAQVNTEYVLDWMLATFDVDTTRVYGVGFSMGGGGALNYAARHLDPAHARFAALVNHTGTVSIAHAWASESPAVRAILEDPLMFGGPPSAFPFEYQRSSTIDLDVGSGTVGPTTDLARNLKHVPMQCWSANFDPLTYLLVQTDALHNWVLGLGGNSARFTVISNLHSWRTLHATTVLDFLGAQSLSVPTEGTHRLLADREARYHHFTVFQDAPGAFTPLRWNMSANQNRLILDQTANLARLAVDTQSLGLDTTTTVTVIFGTQDGSAEELSLDGYANAPLDVRRNGQSTTDWSWNPSLGTVTLYEYAAAGYPQWQVQP